ncbi:hypothetical protein QC760_002908 [Botrytis cinerea]
MHRAAQPCLWLRYSQLLRVKLQHTQQTRNRPIQIQKHPGRTTRVSNAIPWRSITNGERCIETMERRRNVQERPVTVLAGQWQTVNVLWQSSFGTG